MIEYTDKVISQFTTPVHDNNPISCFKSNTWHRIICFIEPHASLSGTVNHRKEYDLGCQTFNLEGLVSYTLLNSIQICSYGYFVKKVLVKIVV